MNFGLESRFRRSGIVASRLIAWALLLVLTLPAVVTPQTRVKIAVWGDSRENRLGACENIADLLLHKVTDWDFQIHTGDFTHDGSDAAWQRSLSYRGIDSLFVPGRFLMCTSNHDAVRSTYDRYTAGVLPVNSADSTTHFFHFQKGNVHVVACDGYFTPANVMNRWLDSVLVQIPKEDWLIGLWHNPCYGDVTYKSSYLNVCGTWLEKFAAHGADFILHGHAHTYVRTYPLLPDGTISFDRGMVHIVNGCGGADFKPPQAKSSKTAFTPDTWSFAMVTFITIEGDVATVETVDARTLENVGTVDRWVWDRSSASRVADSGPSRVPRTAQLLPPAPNPFNMATTICYILPRSQFVQLRLFSATGKLVKTLDEGFREAGMHVLRWDGRDAESAPTASGVYVLQLRAGAVLATRKVIMLR
ncbi:MAG: T9SS type A sorting domain-containing protein [Calditrichaeota bacterium]|nr:T9SS type A sorting domain-containing protein [Calditrichota bacterium]